MLTLFEDRLVENFYPLILTRHLSYLLVGTMTLRERAIMATGEEEVALHGRADIREYHRALGERVDAASEGGLFLNARLHASRQLIGALPTDGEWIAMRKGTVVAARLSAASAARLDWDADHLELPTDGSVALHEIEEAHLHEHIWDLIAENGDCIVQDFNAAGSARYGTLMPGVHVIDPDRFSIGVDSVVKPGCVIDTEHGPVILGANVEVMANAVIEGPCYIGNGSRIKIGAKIYGHTSIGPSCKVGGEVENSIILGHSNKQHDGFLGHSYLGAWVNLGADTNTSDLKNNYGMIRVHLDGREVNTGRMFLGSLIGDHAKTAINTMLNTGTVIGVAANVFGDGFPPKDIPSFAWGTGKERFDIDRAVALARTVYGRRRVPFTDADEALLRRVFERSSKSDSTRE